MVDQRSREQERAVKNNMRVPRAGLASANLTVLSSIRGAFWRVDASHD
jgi:hypothetical protein